MKFVEMAGPLPALYFSPLLHPTHSPIVRRRLVGQSVVSNCIKFSSLFRCTDSFTWAMCISGSGQR